MAATVLACVLTEVVVVGLSALEQTRSFPPPQGEDWLVGMAQSNKAVVIFEGLGVLGGDGQAEQGFIVEMIPNEPEAKIPVPPGCSPLR